MTALVLHPDCGRHDTGWGHLEHQGRLPAIVAALHRDMPDLIDRVLQREAVPVGTDDLRLCHTDEHIGHVRRGVAAAAEAGEPRTLDADTVVSGASWDAALAAAGCVATAADLVLDGEAPTGFAGARPPGHHAGADTAMGFCLFNNVAITARRIQARGVERVLIVDWDVHHGNGTQDIFYDDPSVYYLSLHQSPLYPGTGAAEERGEGAGRNTTRNLPIPAGTGAGEYLDLLRGALDATLAEFEPEFVLVSAGFDILSADPLGSLGLEPADMHALTTAVLDAAEVSADGRVAIALEGGYAPEDVGRGVREVVRALAGLPPNRTLPA